MTFVNTRTRFPVFDGLKCISCFNFYVLVYEKNKLLTMALLTKKWSSGLIEIYFISASTVNNS